MPRRDPSNTALPIAYLTLQILIVLNWMMVAMIITLLVAPFTDGWIMSGLDLTPSPEADRVILGLRAIALLGLAAVPINHVVLRRLLSIVESVRAGDPFIEANAARLQTIAWALVALQCLSLVIGGIVKAITIPGHPIHVRAGFSIHGWLAVFLTFLLARVFAEGTRMREDLDGTV